MATPTVSVVLPVHNRARELPTLLSHLEQQSFPAADLEVVVVDDGSTDGSHKTACRYAAGAPVRMHCVRQPFAGRAKALNLGLHEAHGNWALFIGDDLLASTNWVEGHVRALEGSDGPVYTIGNVLPHPQLPASTLTRWFLAAEYPGPPDPDTLSWMDCSASNFGVQRERLLAVNGFDEAFPYAVGSGHDAAFRLSRRGLQPRLVPESNAYIGFACSFAAACTHYYRFGYCLYRLAQQTDGAAVSNLFPLRPSFWRRMSDTVTCPYYRQLCRETSNPGTLLDPMRRRVFLQQLYRGYQDAQRGRPPVDPVA